MTTSVDPDQAEALKAAVQAEVESETKKQSSSSAVDIGGNVMVDGAGEVIGAAVTTVVEGLGAAAGAAGEAAASVIGGIFEGLGS